MNRFFLIVIIIATVRLTCAVLYFSGAFLLSIPNDTIRCAQFSHWIFLYDISYNEE